MGRCAVWVLPLRFRCGEGKREWIQASSRRLATQAHINAPEVRFSPINVRRLYALSNLLGYCKQLALLRELSVKRPRPVAGETPAVPGVAGFSFQSSPIPARPRTDAGGTPAVPVLAGSAFSVVAISRPRKAKRCLASGCRMNWNRRHAAEAGSRCSRNSATPLRRH